MAWPPPVEFRDAVQNPQQCFEAHDLAQGTAAVTRMGTPLVYSGNFACVFKVTTAGGDVAVRCFTREVKDQRERYAHLSDYLKGVKPEAFVGFEYAERGIRVRGQWYPIVRMDWAEGDRLDKFVADHIDRPDIFIDLAARWRGVNGTLRGLGIAHNDLQHGNVIVQEQGSLRLVDYDGIFLPRFGGQPSPEIGHRHFQHPKRSTQNYHAGIDNFPSLVVYLTLLALYTAPQLWDRFYNQENLLFAREDFADPASSECFKALKGSSDANVARLAVVLEEFCTRTVDQVPPLEDVLHGNLTAPLPAPSSNAPAPPPQPAPPSEPAPSAPPPSPPTSPVPTPRPIDRRCPNCKAQNARLRRDWYNRTRPLRCLNCSGVFGRSRVKRCPGCGSRRSRLRSDWYIRARPMRCRDCNSVFGGTDERAPSKPVVGETPHLNLLLREVANARVDHDTLVDRARGVMMGLAVGNLLGLRAGGQSHEQIASKYPSGIRDIDPKQLILPMDDALAQAVELSEAMLDQGDTVRQFARRLISWRHDNGLGAGRTTRQSIAQLEDGMEPPHAAYAVYQARGQTASNGGILRCAPVAIGHREEPELQTRISADTCATTHYSPLSQWSCVVLNALVAILLCGSEPDLQKLLAAAESDGCPDLLAEGRKAGIDTTVLQHATTGRPTPESAHWLIGARQSSTSHTILTLQAGLWTAMTQMGLEESLVAVVNAGGDTDTNGAVAGAVMGTRYGASAIPLRWAKYVAQKERLTDLGERLVNPRFHEGRLCRATARTSTPARPSGVG